MSTVLRYRARPLEVQAFDLGDGRTLLATEPPRYMASEEFHAAFEVVEERRVVERRRKNGKRPKVERRKAGARGRRKATASESGSGGEEDPQKAEAQRMFEKDGKKVAEISRVLKLPYYKVWSWSQNWKAPKAAKPADEPEDSWMQ